jgi:hypothetical protein
MPSQILAMSGTDISSIPTVFQWLVNGNGALDLQTATNNNAPADSGLTIANNGIINFAAGQTFPGMANGTVTNIATGAGLTGGPITSTGTISIATGGVTNAMLANPSVTINTGTGLSGGGSLALGATLSLSNTGVTSVTGTANQITASGSTGDITLSLPSTLSVNISGNAATATTVAGIIGVANGGTGVNASSTTANAIFAGPATGSPAVPTFRAMASADMPAAQRNRTICYIAGSDSPTAAALSPTNDSIGAYFVNTIGTMTLNSVICYSNSGTVNLNFSFDGLTFGNQFSCSAGGTTTTFATIGGGTTMNSGDFFGLSIFSGATATRATVCISATVN